MSCLAITNQPDTPPLFKSLNTTFGYNSFEWHAYAENRIFGSIAGNFDRSASPADSIRDRYLLSIGG
jgi:hypothetical protein